jgi:adenylate cyclase class IV
MKRNIEIKARAHDLPQTLLLAQALSPSSQPQVLLQEDVFFGVPSGRLKLRTINQCRSELIFYDRTDQTGPKCSSYILFPVANPVLMRQRLDHAYGIRGTVRKRRTLLIVGITRIHLDEVEGLGNFVELEVVLPPDASEQEGVRTARELMRQLKIDDACLLPGAYADFLGFVKPGNVV